MNKLVIIMIAASALTVSAALVVYPATGAPWAAARTAEATAPEAGIMALIGPVRGRIRVLYARNGAMVLLREISIPDGGPVREISLSADGRDLFVRTEAGAYAFSTHTGRIEAQSLLAAEDRHALGPETPRG